MDVLEMVRSFSRIIILVATLHQTQAIPPLMSSPVSPGDVPTSTIGRGPGLRITGRATWYRYIPGHAAAGPKLRAALGAKWRGSIVHVNGIPVRLTDWCQCYKGTTKERLIDLDVRTFAKIASPSRGILQVVVVLP